jgi:hypothetical protein
MKTTIGGFDDSLESSLKDMALYQQTIEFHPDLFMQVRRVVDFGAAKQQNKIGIIFSFDGVVQNFLGWGPPSFRG